MRTCYRFSHRSDDGAWYYWVSRDRVAGDSRSEQVRCRVEWFWNPLADSVQDHAD